MPPPLIFKEAQREKVLDEYMSQKGFVSGPVFDPQKWENHTSVWRRYRTLKSAINSSIYSTLKYDVLLVTSIATAVTAWNMYLAPTYGLPEARLPRQPFDVVGPALSLLLVFRTNASYGRWAEARALWGSTLNRSRDLARQVATYVKDPDLAAQLIRYVAAFPKTMLCHLRPTENLRVELADVLSPAEIDFLMDSHHKPNDCLNATSALLGESGVDPMMLQRMDANITQQHDNLGACERIYKTPIPLSYSRHTSRYIMLYVSLLPFALYKDIGWEIIPASAMIALALLGIEEIGILIEEPFSVLPLEKICDSAHMNSFKSFVLYPELKEKVMQPVKEK